MNKKILFVANNAWSIYNFRKEVLLHFLELKVAVHVISPVDEYVSVLTKMGCQHHPLEFDNKSTNLLKDIRLYFQFKQLYKKISPDLIFHYVAKPNIYGSMAAHAIGIPSIAVITGLGIAYAQDNWLSKLMSALYKWALRSPKEVWFLNQEDANLFENKKIVRKNKIRILKGEGVNVDVFKNSHPPKSNIFTFILTTRLIQSKGVLLFYNAIQQLMKDGLECKGLVLGTYDPLHPDAIDAHLVEEWKVSNDFQYIGHQSDVKPFLASAHCFVFPSYYPEGVPRNLMEAASMSLPIITTHTPGCKDVVIDGKNGYLIAPNDLKALVDAMKNIYQKDKTTLQEMGEFGREWMILHFDVSQIVKTYASTLNKYLK